MNWKIAVSLLAYIVPLVLITSCSQGNEMTVPVKSKAAPVSKKSEANQWRHQHIYKRKNCTDVFIHTHKYKHKDHKHLISDGCEWKIAIKKRQNIKALKKEEIVAAQKKLKAKGYYKGPIDGVITDETIEALNAFLHKKNSKQEE